MWTAISSYLWGETDEQIVPGCPVDDTQTDDDWILVDLRESKLAGKTSFLARKKISQGPIHRFKRKIEQTFFLF